MKPVRKRKATGVLAMLLAENREKELAHARKRMLLAVKIADAMKNAGYSQKEFSQIMGKSETVISEWLSGERNFTVDTLVDIEDALGIQLLNTNSLSIVMTNTEATINSNSRNHEVQINNNSTWVIENTHIVEYQPSYAV